MLRKKPAPRYFLYERKEPWWIKFAPSSTGVLMLFTIPLVVCCLAATQWCH